MSGADIIMLILCGIVYASIWKSIMFGAKSAKNYAEDMEEATRAEPSPAAQPTNKEQLFAIAKEKLKDEDFQTLVELDEDMEDVFSSINSLLSVLELENAIYIEAQLSSVAKTYIKNIDDALNELKRSKIRKKIIGAIIKDNRRLVNTLKKLEESMSKMVARLYDDDNPAHLTDFTSANNLKKIADVFEKVVSEPTSAPAETIIKEVAPKLTLEPYTPPAPKKPEEKLESELKTMALPS